MFSGRANNNKTKIIYTRRAHEQFGYCQAGTSGMLLDDDTALIGTPGPYTWRGTVFAVSVSDDFLHRDKTLYYGPLTQDHSPVDKYSYLGTVIFWSPSYFSSQRTSRLPDAAGPAHKQPMESCVRPGRQPVIKEIDYRLISYSVVWFFLFFSFLLVSFLFLLRVQEWAWRPASISAVKSATRRARPDQTEPARWLSSPKWRKPRANCASSWSLAASSLLPAMATKSPPPISTVTGTSPSYFCLCCSSSFLQVHSDPSVTRTTESCG